MVHSSFCVVFVLCSSSVWSGVWYENENENESPYGNIIAMARTSLSLKNKVERTNSCQRQRLDW
jgi:hypothetical protein